MRLSTHLIGFVTMMMAEATDESARDSGFFHAFKVGRAVESNNESVVRNPSALNEVREGTSGPTGGVRFNVEAEDLHIVTRGALLRRLGDLENRLLQADEITLPEENTLITQYEPSATAQLVTDALTTAEPVSPGVITTSGVIESTATYHPSREVSDTAVVTHTLIAPTSSTTITTTMATATVQEDTTHENTDTVEVPTSSGAPITRTSTTTVTATPVCRKGGAVVGDVAACEAKITGRLAIEEHEIWCKGHCAEVLADPKGTPYLWCQIVGICDLTECVDTFWSTSCKVINA